MKLSTIAIAAIQRYLDLVPRKTLLRGRSYFAGGSVLKFECVEPAISIPPWYAEERMTR